MKSKFEVVIASNYDTHLGDEDIDRRVMDHFIKLFKNKEGKDIRKDNPVVQKLRREVERSQLYPASVRQGQGNRKPCKKFHH